MDMILALTPDEAEFVDDALAFYIQGHCYGPMDDKSTATSERLRARLREKIAEAADGP